MLRGYGLQLVYRASVSYGRAWEPQFFHVLAIVGAWGCGQAVSEARETSGFSGDWWEIFKRCVGTLARLN